MYLLRWTCKVCHRSQSTTMQTGRPWPTVCTDCLMEHADGCPND